MKVFVIGSGPAVEGHVVALAVKALVELGHEVVLLEPNPASTAEAQRTYLEPLTLASAQRVIAAENPDAILAGIGRSATALALELQPSLGKVKWLGPTAESLHRPDAGNADTVVEMAGQQVLGQVETLGETWICPAPLHRAELDSAAMSAMATLGLTTCARVLFSGGRLIGVDPVVGASSAFVSQALGISIPRLQVRLALGLNLDQQPKPGPVAVRRSDATGEVMTLARELSPSAPGRGVVVLGGGGEDAVRTEGYEPIVIDASPSTASRYFEPATLDVVLAVCRKERPLGVIVQLGGAAAAALAPALESEGIRVLGTRGSDIARALDREQFAKLVTAAGLQAPAQGTAATVDEALALSSITKFPLLASIGSEMHYVPNAEQLKARFVPGIFLQAFLTEATQANVELLRDRTGKTVIFGVVEHVEQAGVHTADAACTLPPHSLKPEVIEKLKDAATALADSLSVVGILNVHFAMQGKAVWVLEAKPRASRTLPFVSKATGYPLASFAVRLMLGRTLEELGVKEDPVVTHSAVRESVFDDNVALGLNMRSTGEVMAVADTLSVAFGKSQIAAGTALPAGGAAFLSVQKDDRPAVVDLAQRLTALGFSLLCTEGTAKYLAGKGVPSTVVRKVSEGSPHIAETIRSGGVALIICTVGLGDHDDGQELRQAARAASVPNFTTVEAARMAVGALEAQAAISRSIAPLQSFAKRA